MRLLGHDDALQAEHDPPALDNDAAADRIFATIARLSVPDAVGHRVVHAPRRHNR
ncbi:MAG: hypothetical protein ACTHMY_25175 [Solirubrobacteraceae bacterium]